MKQLFENEKITVYLHESGAVSVEHKQRAAKGNNNTISIIALQEGDLLVSSSARYGHCCLVPQAYNTMITRNLG